MGTFKKIIDKYDKVLSFIVSVIAILGALIAVISFVYKTPDLSVEIVKENLNYPEFITQKAYIFKDNLKKSTLHDTLKNNFDSIYSYLIETKHRWKIIIRNESSRTCSNVSIRITDIIKLLFYQITSDFLSDSEIKEINNSKIAKSEKQILAIENFVNIPKEKTVTIYLWGQFPETTFDQNVIVYYAGGDGVLTHYEQISGFKLYIANRFSEIFIFLALSFTISLYFTLKSRNKYGSNSKKVTGNNP